jgi:uncharacterized protein RhaS with RHS repeats
MLGCRSMQAQLQPASPTDTTVSEYRRGYLVESGPYNYFRTYDPQMGRYIEVIPLD